MTFDLQDLDEEFWSKVVFFQLYHSSGLGGPGALFLVTEEKKKYYLGFEDLPFDERTLAENLHPMFKKTDKLEGSRCPYLIEEHGWVFLKGIDHTSWGNALIREDVYESFREVALNKDLVREKVRYGYHNLPDLVGLALGAESLERVDYIRSVIAQEKYQKRIEELHEEHEREKLLPEHFEWKPMYPNNIAENSVMGEYALIVNRKGDGSLSGTKYTILYQPHMSEPMMIDPSKGTECYVLFKKDYYEIDGPIGYPSPENKWISREENFQTALHELAWFDWASFRDSEMFDHGRFIRCFQTVEEAKEYALCFKNANGGNRFTLIKELDPVEDHRRRVKRYEAYRAYRNHYKKIIDIIVNYDGYPSNSSGGGVFLLEAIQKGVPEITKEQLMYFRHDLPWILEKRTQETIEKELQRSLQIMKELE